MDGADCLRGRLCGNHCRQGRGRLRPVGRRRWRAIWRRHLGSSRNTWLDRGAVGWFECPQASTGAELTFQNQRRSRLQVECRSDVDVGLPRSCTYFSIYLHCTAGSAGNSGDRCKRGLQRIQQPPLRGLLRSLHPSAAPTGAEK